MKVAELMTKHPAFCRPDTNLAEIAGMMWEHACGSIPVVDPSGTVAGIITDRDICIALGTRNVRASEIRADDVAPRRYFACSPEDDVRDALRTMAAQEVRRLPVTDENGHLAGVLSIDDVILRATPGLPVSFRDVVDTLKAIRAARPHGTLRAPQPARSSAAKSS